MRPSQFWLLMVLILGLIIVFVLPAVRHALRPGYMEVDLKSLGYFPFDRRFGTDADIPPRWRKLDGKRVAMEGFMFDSLSTSATRNFQFVYQIANQHGGPPRAQEGVFATVPNGTVPFYNDLVRVEGTLQVKVENPTGELIDTVYRFDVDNVRPVGRIPVVSAGLALIAIMAVLFLVSLFVVLVIRAWNRRKRLQPRSRLCRVCGYDLRASGNRCPECGALTDDGARLPAAMC